MISGHCRLARGQFSLDASFEFPAQGVTGLFGPSGCGKTTLLRCIAGLDAFAGFVRFEDEDWQKEVHKELVPTHERGIGFVFQHTALFPHLDVRGNLLYGMTRRGKTAGAMTLEEVVEFAGVAHLLARETTTLSGGERQRVAIARVILSAPRLMLLDEPLASLDLDSRAMLLPLLKQLRERLTIPMLYVSHAPSEVAALADQVMMMEEGRISEMLSVAQFAERTAR